MSNSREQRSAHRDDQAPKVTKASRCGRSSIVYFAEEKKPDSGERFRGIVERKGAAGPTCESVPVLLLLPPPRDIQRREQKPKSQESNQTACFVSGFKAGQTTFRVPARNDAARSAAPLAPGRPACLPASGAPLQMEWRLERRFWEIGTTV